MDSSLFLQLVISGLTVGAIYAVVALGLVVVYKATDIVNFAQGQFVTLGAYFGLIFHVFLGLPYPLAFFTAVAAAVVIGLILERFTVRPLMNSPEFAIILATFAVSVIIQNVIRLIWRDYTFSFPPIASSAPVELLGVRQSVQNLLIVGVSLIIMGLLFLLFRKTRLGLAMRATALNRQAAWLMGVKASQIYGTTWALSAALGAAAGLLIAPLLGVRPDLGDIMIKAFVAALLGGFSSLPGAIFGGFALGVLETVAGGFVSNAFKDVLTFAVMMAVIVFLPNGFFGRATIKKV